MRKKNYLIRLTAFIAIFVLLLLALGWVFSYNPDQRIYQWVGGFYEEPADSLAAVYIGASNCYSFWNPLVAWRNYGLAVYPYATPSMPFYASEYVIREARKTQPDALFIVNVNSVEADDLNTTSMHHLLDYMPDSQNKTNLMNYLGDLLDLTPAERLEFRFPFIRMRTMPITVVKSIIRYGFPPELDGFKGASRYGVYLAEYADIKDEYIHTDETTALSEDLEACIDHLLDYCDEEEVKILFVTVPRAEKDLEALRRINAVNDRIRARSFPVLDLSGEAEVLGMDLTQDYYNGKHTNIHGSIKFTNFLSEYLLERYDLENLRGDAAYDSWDAAWEAYAEGVSPGILDLELDAAHRDYSLKAPAIAVDAGDDASAALEWTAVEGADGYKVFRKDGYLRPWREIAEVSKTSHRDAGLERGVQYYYTVVPLRRAGDETFYGNFLYGGVLHRP